MFQRVILKLSGEGLAGHGEGHYHSPTVSRIVAEVHQLLSQGVQVGIVVGGGNIWRGRDADPAMDKVKAHQIGMMATLLNGLYLAEAFRIHTPGNPPEKQVCAVLTPFTVGAFTEPYNRDKALAYMEAGVVPIFAGGTGHPFFSTDSIVAIRACELKVDAVLYGKNVDSVYEQDPRKNPQAKRYQTLSYQTALANRLDVADLNALELTASNGIASIVFGLDRPGSIVTACQNDEGLYAMGGTKIANGLPDVFYA